MAFRPLSWTAVRLLFALMVLGFCAEAVSANPAVLSTTSLNFANQVVGVTSGPQTVLVTNTGPNALSQIMFRFVGNSYGFALTTSCGTTVVVSGVCGLTVTFTPSTLGAQQAIVSFSDTDSITGASYFQSINLNGTGVPAASPNPAVLSTSSLSFADQFVGVTSGTQTVLLTNTGPNALSQISFVPGGINIKDFALTTSCGMTMPVTGICALTVTFTPSKLGPEQAMVTFSDMDSHTGASYSQVINLTGTGAPAAVPSTGSLTLTSLFTGGPSAAQSISVQNAGSDSLNQGSFVLSGANASDFILTTTCGTITSAGSACSVSVLFAPSTASNESATLTFTDSDAHTGEPYTQSIALVGVPTAALPGSNVPVAIISKHSGKALDVLEASMLNGAPIQQYDFLGGSNQQWSLIPGESGYYQIQSVGSGKVLDVIAASTENGAGVQQWAYLGTDNQQWQLNQMSDGSFQIVNKGSSKLLDVTGLSTQDGTTLQQWDSTGADNQKWMITAQPYFTLTSLNSNKVLDVTGYSTADGALIQQWQSLGGANQAWQFVPLGNGCYEILNKLSGKALEATGSPVVDGSLVQQATFAGSENQEWQLVPSAGGYYTIVNKSSGKVLDVVGVSTSDGAGLQVYTYLGGRNQQWHLDPIAQ